jgi:diadenylate cyclase
MEGTRGEGILKGIALLMIMFPILLTIVAERFQILDRLLVIIRFFGAAAIPVIVIVVQPELRRALVRLGQTRLFGFLLKGPTEGMMEEIVKAAFRMSRRKIGALIAIEREVGLKNYVERGTRIDSLVTGELLSTIFFPGSDLHDGAVVIQKERIAAAGCLFPLSDNPDIGNVLGTRHRAALGISEETDAIVIVVSEETGTVSFVNRGKMERPLDVEQLRALLYKYYAQLEERELADEVPLEENLKTRGSS